MELIKNEKPDKFKIFLESRTGRQLQEKLKEQLNAVMYTRVSSKEQLKGYSLEIQEREIREYAKKNNINIVAAFGGTYESAATDERVEFEKMRKFIKTSKVKINLILVQKTDRFSRSGPEAIYIKDKLKETGVFLQAVSQQVEAGTPAGDLQQNMLLIFSSFDNQLRRDRTIEGIKAKLSAGEWPCKPKFGYIKKALREGEKPTCIIDETKARFVKFIFEAVGNKGWTQLRVKKELKDMGVKMNLPHISKILHDSFYSGYMEHGILEGDVKKGNHEPIISEELFRKVQKRLDMNPHGYIHDTENNNFPLKSIVLCDNCGYPLTAYEVPYGDKRYHYYKCQNSCRVSVKTEILHNIFKLKLRELVINPALIPLIKAQLINTFTQLNEVDVNSKKLYNTQLTEENKKLDTLKENLGQGRVPTNIYEELEAKYLKNIKQIEGKLGLLDYDTSKIDSYLQKAFDISSNMLKIWEISDYDGRKRLHKLVFPEGLKYNPENDEPLKGNVNSVFDRMACLARDIEVIGSDGIDEKKNQIPVSYYSIESSKTLWEELKRIGGCFLTPNEYVSTASGSTINTQYSYVSSITGSTANILPQLPFAGETGIYAGLFNPPISASTIFNSGGIA